MATNHNFVLYSRDNGGRITREHRDIMLDDVAEYTYFETLKGWPESKVFWRFMADGSATGIAANSEAARRVLSAHSALELR